MTEQAELSTAFSTIEKAVTQSAQGAPAILQLLERVIAQNDRLLEVHHKQLAAQHAGEALMGRMHNMSVSWMRKEGPYKVVKRGEDGADPTAEPYNLPGLWYISSLQALNLETAQKYLDFYGFGKPAADVSLEDARHTIAAECGMAEWQDEPPAAEEKK